jgi:flagellar motility protein MotE (MotC chaperone)
LKKLIVVCEILIILVFLTKITLISPAIKRSKPTGGFISVKTASAEATTGSSHDAPVKKALADNLSEERQLLSALLEKHTALDGREEYLKSEEKRLNLLKGEILLSIDKLQNLEDHLAIQFDVIKGANDKKYKDLAKIYESAPPKWVGAMLEKLDSQTSAAIIMNMKNKSAGTVLGYLSPGKSIEITREITQTHQTP